VTDKGLDPQQLQELTSAIEACVRQGEQDEELGEYDGWYGGHWWEKCKYEEAMWWKFTPGKGWSRFRDQTVSCLFFSCKFSTENGTSRMSEPFS
jgi:hypothetical protein